MLRRYFTKQTMTMAVSIAPTKNSVFGSHIKSNAYSCYRTISDGLKRLQAVNTDNLWVVCMDYREAHCVKLTV